MKPFDLCDSSLLQFPSPAHPPPPAAGATPDKSYQQYPPQQFPANHQQNHFNYGAWPQFNGFPQSPGFSYNYNGFNAGAASGAPPQQNWNHQQWNNWNYYGPNHNQDPSTTEASSYQRTLEYVQQQSSWSANN